MSFLWNVSQILNSLPNYLRLEVAKFLYKKFITKVKIFEDADPEFVRAIIGRIEPEVYLPDTWVIRKVACSVACVCFVFFFFVNAQGRERKRGGTELEVSNKSSPL